MIATDLRASLAVFALGTLGLALGTAAGCGGGGKGSGYPDASVGGTGGRTGTGGGIGTGTGGSIGGGTGGTIGGGTGGGAPDAGTPDGPVATAGIRLFSSVSALVGPGFACSRNQVAAGAPKPDQWCGVIRPAAAGAVSLSVINLTKAMAGTAITCAAGDPNCLLLSNSLSGAADDNSGFFGDTLVYYETASIFVWRPGWAAPRVLLAHDQTASCAAGPTTAICIKATANTAVLNLYAGLIDPAGGPLTLIEGIDATIGNVAFSSDLLSVLWSTRTTATTPETLKMQTIGDAASRRTVATNVTAWNQSPDGSRWYWLSTPTLDPVAMVTTGTLQSAPYPAGTGPVNIHTTVIQYAPWTDTSAMVLALVPGPAADLKAIANVDNPVATARVIQAGTAVQFSDLTPSGTVLYSTDGIQPDPVNNPNNILLNLFTSKADATGKCTVTTATEADSSAFLTRSGLGVGWVRAAAAAGLFEGRFTALGTCTTTSFSTTLSGFQDAGGGIVLIESYNATAFTAALGLAPYAADGTLGARVAVHPGANPTIMPLYPDIPRIVYSLNQTAFEGGIYVSAPLGGVVAAFNGISTDAASGTAAGSELARRAGRPASVVAALAKAGAPRALRTSLLPKARGTVISPISQINPSSQLIMLRQRAAAAGAGASATKAAPSATRSAR